MRINLYKQLDSLHIEDLNNPIHPSIYIKHQNYKLLMLRLPLTINNGEIDLVTHGFIIQDKDVFFYQKTNKTFTQLESGWESLYRYLDESIDKTLKLVNDYREQIINMEDDLYNLKIDKTFLHHWFATKKSLILLNRILVRALYVFEEFYNQNSNNINSLTHSFHDLLEHLNRSQRYIDFDIEKLNAIYSFYSARSNDKMNHAIYLLTILSAIFLPLNLIVGFFGMNTGSLPLTKEGGTFGVISILGSILITLLLLFFILKINKAYSKRVKK